MVVNLPAPCQVTQRKYTADFLIRLTMLVTDLNTGELLEYQALRKHHKLAQIWSRSYSNKMGQLYQDVV